MPWLGRPLRGRRWRRRPTRCGRAGPSEYGSRRSRPGGFGNIGRGLGLREALAAQEIEEAPSVWRRAMSASVSPSARRVAEMAPAVDHLLGRAAADAELQTPAGDEVGRARVLRHVERVLVAHVDDGGADLDAAGLARRPPPAAGRARRAGARSGARGNRRRRRPAPRPPRRGRWIAAARPRPSASPDWREGVQWPKERKPIFFMLLL